jgi:hypothetical protein
MENHRIKAKLGPHEFDAEGDRELVSKQYDQFLAAVTAIAQTPNPMAPGKPDGRQDNISGEPSADVLNRVFRNDEPFSLLAKPKSDNADADGLIVLMYGMAVLKSEKYVTGAMLMKSAKQSGLKLKADRVDRTIDEYINKYVNAAGNKRGLRYSLNNEGIKHAVRLIKELE